MLVSVIIPVRNSELTLAATLDCLIRQTDAAWEALIVDNVSADRTAEIIEAYCEKDSRFKHLNCATVGTSAARNVGLANANGERVLFLDSDDWVDARFLALMNGAMNSTPEAVAAYCNYCRVLPDGAQTTPRSNPQLAERPFEAFARTCAVAIHAVLIERRILQVSGGFDPSLRTCEDWDLWQRAARVVGRWVHVDHLLSFYRVSDRSLTQDVQQMLTDARVVIARGFRYEDKPKADAYRRRGADPELGSAETAFAFFSLWCAAFDCGRGRKSLPLPAILRNLPRNAAADIAVVLSDGLAVGRRTLFQSLAQDWVHYGSTLTELINAVGHAWNDPVAGRRLQYQFEQLVLDYDDLAQPRQTSLTLGVRVDLHRLCDTEVPRGVDRLYIYLCAGTAVRALWNVGVLGKISKEQWLELAIRQLGVDEVANIAALALGKKYRVSGLRGAARMVLRRSPLRLRRLMLNRILAGGTTRSAPQANHSSLRDVWHCDRLRHILHQADADAGSTLGAVVATSLRETADENATQERQNYWERVFAEVDPWNYSSEYEQVKYGRQLQILPDRPIECALEVACAEGSFTLQLAPRVKSLIAADISTTALERARERCRGIDNVSFRRLDLRADALPSNLDLIVCSEVLYYLDDEDELRTVVRRLVDALRPDGCIIMAHAYISKDDPSVTGFDWDNPFGAKQIAAVFDAIPDLELQRSIRTELYRADRYALKSPNRLSASPQIETVPLGCVPEPEVERFVVWGGSNDVRHASTASEPHFKIPVLMYHSISKDGPPALERYRIPPDMFRSQMEWLRQNGYYAICSQQLEWFITNRHPFTGRPVMISFDDGYQDFSDNAWPILKAFGFRAEVFVVTDLLGDTAAWDACRGNSRRLMSAETIRRLSGQGALFGSHLASHRSADGLSTEELTRELARSASALRQYTGAPVCAFSAPFGRTDQRLRLLAEQCGYRVGFSTEARIADTSADDILNLPRIEIRSDANLQEICQLFGSSK